MKVLDDTAMVGLITNNDSSQYVNEIYKFMDYCKPARVIFSNQPFASKTKEMFFYFRTNSCRLDSIVNSDSPVEWVHSY